MIKIFLIMPSNKRARINDQQISFIGGQHKLKTRITKYTASVPDGCVGPPLRFKTATRDDDAETNYFKRMTGQKSCHILSIRTV